MSYKSAVLPGKSFHELIQTVHETCGWSLRELSSRTDLDHSYIWQIVYGKRHPSRDALIKLCLYGWALELDDVNVLLEACGYKSLTNSRSKLHSSELDR